MSEVHPQVESAPGNPGAVGDTREAGGLPKGEDYSIYSVNTPDPKTGHQHLIPGNRALVRELYGLCVRLL